MNLTPNETKALKSLRDNQEGIGLVDSKGEWGSIYLDNAKPREWEPRTWAGVLSSLSQKGLYREDDGWAFGLVLMPKVEK